MPDDNLCDLSQGGRNARPSLSMFIKKIFGINDEQKPKEKIVWVDLGDLGDLVNPAGPHEQWQDHGLGLLRTILHQNGVMTDLLSTRAITSWDQLKPQLKGYEMMIMNVRDRKSVV